MISVNNSLISFLTFGSLCSERQHCLSLGKKRHRHYLDMYISSGAPNSVYSGHSNEPSFGFWQFMKQKAMLRKFFFRGSMTRSTTNSLTVLEAVSSQRFSVTAFYWQFCQQEKQSELRKSTVHRGKSKLLQLRGN